MRSFLMDLRRGILSPGFIIGMLIMIFILERKGVYSDLFKICVPIVSAFPYSTSWILDYKSGFIKCYLVRTNINSYILGKLCACGILGGLVVAGSIWIFETFIENTGYQSEYILFFMTGVLWSVLAATMAVWSNNPYIAYGGAFVVCYLLVILHDRYFDKIYYIYPYEWMFPENVWKYQNYGIVLFLLSIIVILMGIYYGMVRRKIRNV